MPQFTHELSGSLVITVCHVPMYRPPSPPWIRGIGNLSTSTASPRLIFSLHGPLFTTVGAISFSLRFKYDDMISLGLDVGDICMAKAVRANKPCPGCLLGPSGAPSARKPSG